MKTNSIENDLSKMTINGSSQEPITTSAMTAEEADAKNQADADSEVSQINTQNVVNDASMQEFRGMTSSAVSAIKFSHFIYMPHVSFRCSAESSIEEG